MTKDIPKDLEEANMPFNIYLKKITWTKLSSFLFGMLLLFFNTDLLGQPQNQKTTIRSVLQKIPTVTGYSPNKYNAEPQNWCVLQDNRGILYFGNAEGLLIYDGVSWRLLKNHTNSAIRSLAIGKKGRIYYGAQGDFGYLDADENGKPRLNSLIHKIPSEYYDFNSVPNTYNTPNGIAFHTLKGTYFYQEDTDTIYIARPKAGILHLAHQVWDDLYVFQHKRGLLKLEGSTESGFRYRLLPEGEKLANNFRIESILPYDASEQNSGRLLIATVDQGLFLYDPKASRGKRLSSFETPSDSFLKENRVYCGTKLKNGYFAYGTFNGGIIILNKKGEAVYQADSQDGLANNLIWAIYPDQRENLWIAHNDGISHIEFQSPFSIYDESLGLKGMVHGTKRFGDFLYVGTGEGLFLRPWQSSKNPFTDNLGFAMIPNSQEKVIKLKVFDNQLFICHSQALYKVTPRNELVELHPYQHVDLIPWKDKLYGATTGGFMIYEKLNGEWQHTQPLKGLSQSVSHVAQENDGTLWFSSPFQGLHRLLLNEKADSVLKMDFYNQENGLPSSRYNFPFYIGEELLAATLQGIYLFNKSSNRFEKHSFFSRYVGEADQIWSIRKIVNSNDYLLNSEKGILILEDDEDGNYQLQTSVFQKINPIPILNINTFNEQEMLFGSAQGLIYFDREKASKHLERSKKTFAAMVRKVVAIQTDSLLFGGFYTDQSGQPIIQRSAQCSELPFHMRSLRFEVGSNWYEASNKTTYQYKLEGFDKDWTIWSNEHFKEYTNLPSGKYVFNVRAKNVYGLFSAESSYEFSISAPWYFTIPAFLFYIFVSVGIVWSIVKVNTLRLQKEKTTLERIVRERTYEIAQQKEEIEEQHLSIVEQHERLKNLNEEKDNLLSILAHDMRNPLSQIKGLITISRMEFPDLKKGMNSHLKMMEQAVDRLNDMIGKILDARAAEQGMVELQLEETNLKELLQEVTEGIRPSAEAKKIKISQEYIVTPCWAMLDRNFTIQLFENLIINALKFSPPDRNVFIRLEKDQKVVRATIRDEGQGILPEDMPKLFGRFQKLTARPTAGEPSTGLGLSIVKQYVEAMNGKVWCESKAPQEKGATFFVEFTAVEKEIE